MRRGAARCDGGGGDGGAGGVSGSGAGVKVIAHMRNGELLSGTIADDIVGSVSSSAAGVSNKVVMATEATDGRFSQEQRTMEEVDSGGRNRRSKKSGTCSGSSGGCGGYGSAYGHDGSGGVSGSGGRDGSGRGGGGVDAVEEIEVGIYAYQGDRASAEDGDSESERTATVTATIAFPSKTRMTRTMYCLTQRVLTKYCPTDVCHTKRCPRELGATKTSSRSPHAGCRQGGVGELDRPPTRIGERLAWLWQH